MSMKLSVQTFSSRMRNKLIFIALVILLYILFYILYPILNLLVFYSTTDNADTIPSVDIIKINSSVDIPIASMSYFDQWSYLEFVVLGIFCQGLVVSSVLLSRASDSTIESLFK